MRRVDKNWSAFIKQASFIRSLYNLTAMLLPVNSKVKLNLIPFKGVLAYTDHKSIYITTNNPVVEKANTIVLKKLIIIGLITHEIGHILYTDKKTALEVLTRIENYRIPPVMLKKETYDKKELITLGRSFINTVFLSCEGYLDSDFLNCGEMVLEKDPGAIAKLLHKVENGIEDEYEERRLKETFAGSTIEDSLNQLKEIACRNCGKDMEGILFYMQRWQTLPRISKEYQKEKSQLKSLLPVVINIAEEDDITVRYRDTLLCILRLYNYFKPMLKGRGDEDDADADDSDLIKQLKKEIADAKSILEKSDQNSMNMRDVHHKIANSILLADAMEADAENAREEAREKQNKENCKKMRSIAEKTEFYDLTPHISIPKEGNYDFSNSLMIQAEEIAGAIKDVIHYEEEEELAIMGEWIDTDMIALRGTPHKMRNEAIPYEANLCVLYVYDQSGSMYGRRIRKCSENAKIMHAVGEILKIPTAIIGFQWKEIFIYSDFEMQNNAIERISEMKADGSNHDANALSYAVSMIKNRPESIKIIVMITDGQPCCQVADLKKAIHKADREQIYLIAAAIAEDKKQIESIYGSERFLDISDLNTLSEQFTELIKEFVV